ncbi:hypothetical protein AB1285_25775 [Microbacterium sp. NRRL B-14842]|uniref:hypothetical protein n=1 Tax=Microbacterium sp. NRRL B-14842 TaxID=3162881 RepID=UPI003D28774E
MNMGNGAIKSGSADYIEARNNVFVDAYAPYDNYEQWMGDQEGNVVDRDYMPALGEGGSPTTTTSWARRT